MQKLYVEQLQPGMLMGQDILNEQGQVLLARQTPLTVGYIEGLRVRGHSAVWIMDGISDDVEPPDILSPSLRSSTSKHLQDLFSTVGAAAQSDEARTEEVVYDEIATAVKPQLAEMFRDAEAIVDEIASAKVISGVMSLKTYDSYTYEHSVEVALAAVLLGKRFHLESHELEILALGCLFHDIGKVMVPKEILNKPDRLTPEEFEVIKRHPEAGYQMVRRILGETSVFARHIARQHHERQDGKGYPQGLRGNNDFKFMSKREFGQGLMIPAAEITAVADVYSALASDRPYRAGMSPEEVISAMSHIAGSHLNRELVARFLSILPAYPVCTQVMIIAGKLSGYRGIVTALDPKKLNRPTVRILYDPMGRQIAPFEVDTGAEQDLELATPSYALMA